MAMTPEERPEGVAALARGVIAQERRSLARAITLIESAREDQSRAGQELLEALLPQTGKGVRVGITGTPGVGKSTFIESLGLMLIKAGHRVAVLAVDPSSPLSGGSILGDKTRMEELAKSESAFIRPSPSSGALGGVARRSREALLLCEAAGYDVVMVETVGVGQSEVEVSSMVDTFLLLLQPASGDSLQGVKRGVLELADLAVVNKCDGALQEAAERTRQQYELGLSLLRPTLAEWTTPVISASALTGKKLDDVWQSVLAHRAQLEKLGELETRRSAQAERWMWTVLREEVERRIRTALPLSGRVAPTIAAVREGRVAPTMAALSLVEMALSGNSGQSS